ncbi:Uncharacterized protein FWK35_00027106 [Aphis craccivora]|uniref:Uncharacterized protein n=1 Tax=Aphis craccivora TaxID=307492 RepID=A0A6G0WY52_APHCR|nr:Uncharacterized protein FWK35_00027106 [Aphis craccivora]
MLQFQTLEVVSVVKVNILEKQKKNDEKREFLRKTSFRPNQFFYIVLFILDSERSEECIDFTMIITSRNNAPISNYEGGFRCKSEYPCCIIEVKS